MRDKWSSNAVFCVVAAALAGPLYAQSATPKPEDPCEQIHNACIAAGYHERDANKGEGLWYDCVDPIMKGKKPTGKKQPDVSSQVIAACRAKDPTYPSKAKAKAPKT
jgi:hypothetical protein